MQSTGHQSECRDPVAQLGCVEQHNIEILAGQPRVFPRKRLGARAFTSLDRRQDGLVLNPPSSNDWRKAGMST